MYVQDPFWCKTNVRTRKLATFSWVCGDATATISCGFPTVQWFFLFYSFFLSPSILFKDMYIFDVFVVSCFILAAIRLDLAGHCKNINTMFLFLYREFTCFCHTICNALLEVLFEIFEVFPSVFFGELT